MFVYLSLIPRHAGCQDKRIGSQESSCLLCCAMRSYLRREYSRFERGNVQPIGAFQGGICGNRTSSRWLYADSPRQEQQRRPAREDGLQLSAWTPVTELLGPHRGVDGQFRFSQGR